MAQEVPIRSRINSKKTWGNPLFGVSLSRPTRFENDEFDPNRANASIFGTSGSPRLLWDTDRSKILKIRVTLILVVLVTICVDKNFCIENDDISLSSFRQKILRRTFKVPWKSHLKFVGWLNMKFHQFLSF